MTWQATQRAILEMGRGPEMCANASKHTRPRKGYLDRAEWAKTHNQSRCKTCGFWVMWRKKP